MGSPRGAVFKGRFVVLDFYRYVAAAAVFLFHVEVTTPGLPIASYGLFVDMFFILSGFVLFLTYGVGVSDARDYRNFMVKRLARVFPLHFAVLVLFVLIGSALGGLPSGTRFVREFVVNALLLQAWGLTDQLNFATPAWSISGEFACYLVFPLIATAAVRLPLGVSFAVVALAYVAGVHGGLPIWVNPHSQMYGASFDFGVIRALVGFVNGVLLCRLFAAMRPRAAYLPIGAAIMLAVLVIMSVFAKPDLIILLMAAGLVATALGERAAPISGWPARVLEWLGNTSYAIYLLHWMVVIWIVDPLLRTEKMPPAALWTTLLGFTIALTLVSHLVFRWFEAPARRWVTARFTRSARTAGRHAAVAETGEIR